MVDVPLPCCRYKQQPLSRTTTGVRAPWQSGRASQRLLHCSTLEAICLTSRELLQGFRLVELGGISGLFYGSIFSDMLSCRGIGWIESSSAEDPEELRTTIGGARCPRHGPGRTKTRLCRNSICLYPYIYIYNILMANMCTYDII